MVTEKKRILVVDDEENMRSALFDVLEIEGYAVSTSADKEEALRLLHNIEFDLLLLDLRLKGSSGLDLISAVKEIKPHIAVIVITGYPNLDSAIESLRLGISDYLLKPISIESLKASIQNALLQKDKERQKSYLLKKLEEAEKKSAKLEETLSQATKLISLGKIAPSMFHEVKNLLGIMNISIYYIKKSMDTKDPKVKKHIEIIEKEIEHSNQIIMGMLELSRRQEDKYTLCDINQLTEEALSLLAHELELKGIKIIKEYAEHLPFIPCEPHQIKQVFINIVLNAQDAMPKGGELRVKTGRDNDSLYIKFMDTGCGIKKGDLEKIFTPFFTTKKESGGMGLGLVVSQDIVKRYEGTILVESIENKGSIFTVRFPINKKSAAEEEKIEKENSLCNGT
ncbi:MAG: response regulator [Candidatus Omnitrophica bacterium]|nr:response regulator [Candidatus Omnitrophota bacterium]